MFLTDNFNVLIEASKYALYVRHTAYPSPQNEKGDVNMLRTELRRPASPGGLYEASVAFLGPWQKNMNIPVALWHIFNGFEKEVLLLQNNCESGSFITEFEYTLKPKPEISYCNPSYDENEGEWNLNVKRNCLTQGEITENITELVFKSSCSEALDDKLAENFKQFLSMTCFMFYDVTVEFNFWGESFQRNSIDLPVPWSTSKRLKHYLKWKLGQAVSVGSAWISQDDAENVQPFDVTAVNYGVAGEGKCLPVWVLGPSGIPLVNFNKTFIAQLVCQAAELPIDHIQFEPPSGLPAPDVCLEIPPGHFLSKKINYFLIVVLLLPMQHRNLHNHATLVKTIEPVSQRYWEAIVETLKEVTHNPRDKAEDTDDFRFCHGIAAALGTIIQMSFSTNFKKQCFKLLEVNNSIDGQDSMEQQLLDQLQQINLSLPNDKIYKVQQLTPDYQSLPKESDQKEEQTAKAKTKQKESTTTASSSNNSKTSKNNNTAKKVTRNLPAPDASAVPAKKKQKTKKVLTTDDTSSEQLDKEVKTPSSVCEDSPIAEEVQTIVPSDHGPQEATDANLNSSENLNLEEK